MFLAEGREHLQELNLAVVRIEETPDDQDTVDEIFRIAHSLKGMSATMGFAGMAALTHEMEDVFELLRQRRGGLERAAIDVLLECLDALEAAVDAIESDGAEAIDTRSSDRPAAHAGARRRGAGRSPPRRRAAAIEPPADLGELAQGRRVVQVVATLAADASIPSVRAYMVLSKLAELGETLACRPDPDALEGFSGTDVVAWLVSDRTDAELAQAAINVPEVDDVVVLEAVPDAAVDNPESLDSAPDTPSAPAAEPTRQAPSRGHGGSSTVRVDAERLDQLMHAMGELVLNRTHVESLAANADVPGLPQALQALTRTSHQLQAMVMQVRMIPVEAVLLRFPRLVRDLSVKLSKQVDLELIGKDTELDRSVVDSLGDPLVHLIRNSLDHGLEGARGAHRGGQARDRPPGDRRAPRRRQRRHLRARRRPRRRPGPGRAQGLRARADLRRRGRVDRYGARDRTALPSRLLDLRRDVGHLRPRRRHGRRARRHPRPRRRGHDDLRARPGHDLRDPPAADAGDHVGAAGARRRARLRGPAGPDRAHRAASTTIPVRSVMGRRMLVMSDGVLPLICGSERFGGSIDVNADFAVIMRGAGVRVAFAVSALDGQRELVTRPLPPEVAEGSALSGAAVLSDGQIALIVDCDAVAEGGRERSIQRGSARRAA